MKSKAKPSLERRQRTNGRFVVATAHVAMYVDAVHPPRQHSPARSPLWLALLHATGVYCNFIK